MQLECGGIFQGFREIKQNLNVETALVQTQSPVDFEDSLRDFASCGFKIIFAHGFEYTDAALRVGEQFAKTWFIVTSESRSAARGHGRGCLQSAPAVKASGGHLGKGQRSRATNHRGENRS